MADEPEQDQESSPSLEPPRLFGRRQRKPKPKPEPAAEPAATTEPEPTPEPEPEPPPEPAPEPTPEPVAVEEPPTEPFETPRSSAPQEPPVPLVDPVVEEEPTAVYDATDPTTDVMPVATATPEADKEAEAAEQGPPPRRWKPRTPREHREPVASPRTGAVLTGVVAGALLVGLVSLGFQACEAARGSNSCGTVPGMGLLLLVFALTVVASGALLRYFRVPDPGVTGFVAVALVGVVALFFVDQLVSWPVLIALPLVSAAAFLLSWWVTTTYVEPQG